MNLNIAHQNTLFILSWSFILQINVLKTENVDHDHQAIPGHHKKREKQHSNITSWNFESEKKMGLNSGSAT